MNEPQPGECFWHGAEPIPEDVFRVCGECGHAWPTAEAYAEDVRALHWEMGWLPDHFDPDPPFCPLCSHDW